MFSLTLLGIVAIALAIVFLLGLATLVDRLTFFRFKGKVLDERTESPISGAKLSFMDKGLDYRRSKEPEKYVITIGETDSDGVFDYNIDYMWGENKKLLKIRRIPKLIALSISKDGYHEDTFDFELIKLPVKKGEVQVPIGEVHLSPRYMTN